MPSTLSFDPETAALLNAEVQLNAGTAAFSRGDYESALRTLNLCVELDPELGPAYALRAVTRHSLGDSAGALADADRAVAYAPDLTALRAVLHAYAGRRGEALRDVRAARAVPEPSDAVLQWCAMALVTCEEFAQAEAVAHELLDLNPHSVSAQAIDEQLDLFYRQGPTKARDTVARQRRTPVALSDALTEALNLFSAGQFGPAVEAFDACLMLADRLKHPDVDAGRIRDLGEMLQVIAHASSAQQYRGLGADADFAGDVTAADKLCGDFVKRHPDWASGKLLTALVDVLKGRDPATYAATLADAARTQGSDPLLAEYESMFGSARFVARMGIIVWMSMGNPDSKPSMDVLAAVVEGLDGGFERELVRAMHEAQPMMPPNALKVLRAAHKAVLEKIEPKPRPNQQYPPMRCTSAIVRRAVEGPL